MPSSTAPLDPRPTWFPGSGRRIGRYFLGPSLGRGGMGEVFRAWDPTLGREIALKVLGSWNAEAAVKLMQEARLQARVDHPNVCPVLDVDVAGDLPYIAMQVVNGPTMKEAMLDQREAAAAIQAVAGAIHAAHRLNLIHRDLKPTNILLERNERGSWTPFVCDFGLAKDLGLESASQSQAKVGTPAFMSPEQMDSHGRSIGPAVDIFGLGATLYDTVVGCPPVRMRSGEVGHAWDPIRKPRDLNPSVPRPLEQILLRCLEWDPADRYPTAAALAEDLRRFLDGESLQPGAWNPWAHLRWHFRRRPWAFATLSAGLILALGLAGVAAWSRREVVAQAKAAERFTGTIKDLQYLMRLERMLPPHDLRLGLSKVRVRMAEIEASMAKLGAVSKGPGAFAMGWGHLLLREPEQALQQFQSAWDAGYRSPEAATAWAKAHCEAFTEALPSARHMGNEAVDSLKRKHLEPARALLAHGEGSILESPLLVAAQLENLDGRPRQALALARKEGGDPLRYEARIWEAAALTDLGFSHQIAGRYSEAESFYFDADGILHGVQALARSDELALKMELNRLLAWIAMKSEAGGQMPRDFDRIEALADRLLALNPEWLPAIADKLTIIWRRGEFDLARGRNPESNLGKGMTLLQRAESLPHATLRLQRDRAALCRVMGEWLYQQGRDPRGVIEMGLKGSLMDEFAADLLILRARWALDHGLDPKPDLSAAGLAIERPTFLQPGEYGLARRRLEINYWEAASESLGTGDPTPALERALEASRSGLSLNPNSSDLLIESADCLDLAYQIRSAQSKRDASLLRQGLSFANRAYSLRACAATALCLARLHLRMAEHAMATRGNPSNPLAEVERRANEVRHLQSNHPGLSPIYARYKRLRDTAIPTPHEG